jgi:uncharacterized protein (DUF697 family)
MEQTLEKGAIVITNRYLSGAACFRKVGDLMTPDERADLIIKGMASTGVAGALIPLPLGIPFMGVVGAGVVSIGHCYGVELTKDQAWKLVRQFFKAAGFTYMALFVGWQFITGLGKATGFGYPVAVALDATQGAIIAYAVGAAAKAYFKGERDNKELGALLRNAAIAAKRAGVGR